MQSLNSLKEYNEIDEEDLLVEKIGDRLPQYQYNIIRAERNAQLWKNYQKEYKEIENYLSEDEIKNIPYRRIRIKTFQQIERKLYKSMRLLKPVCGVVASIDVLYSSPQGRNNYKKSARLTHKEIKALLPIIEQTEEVTAVYFPPQTEVSEQVETDDQQN